MRTVVECVFRNAEHEPTKKALLDGKMTITYKELKEQIILAKQILEKVYGLKQGDDVIIAANKQLSFVSVYFACHLIGAVTLPIAPDTNEKRFSLIYNKVNPKLVVGFENEIIQCCTTNLNEFENIMAPISSDEVSFPSLEWTADIIFTTGTTGEPKGVQLSQKNIAAAVTNINTFIGNSSEDVEMLALPISHSFGLGRLRCALANGQTVVVLGSFANMKRFFRFMEDYNVTGFGMVPASWAMIKKLSGEKIAEFDNQLRYIEIGSAPMPLEDKKLLIRLLPNARICMHYGLTEASRSAFIEFHKEEEYLDTIGKQSPNMCIEIRDEQGNKVDNDVEGEICVKGDAVTAGYYMLPEVNKDSFWGEYFRTGDWGKINGDGYIYLCSRKKELINVGGKKVSPIEVEEVLMDIDGIDECVCIAIPDPNKVLGDVVKAFIVTKTPEIIVKEELNKIVSMKLEDYKVPVEYECIEEIPKTSSGKVQRLSLRNR